MGKLEANSSINHFSHEHPLKLQTLTTKSTCLACNMSVSGSLIYTCVSCNFYLHKTCSNIPRTLKHQSDKSHNLVLLSSPAYPEGVFRCNACGLNGSGFSYHCPDCQLDLHVVCASMPLTFDHASHGHTLGLCFTQPYENHGFSCDICKQPGSNQWLYRCGSCEFDAHMTCTTARAGTKTVLEKSTSLPIQPPVKIYYSAPPVHIGPQVVTKSTSVSQKNHQFYQPQPPPPPPSPLVQASPPTPIQPYYYQTGPSMGVPRYGPAPLFNQMAGHAVEGFVGSVTQEIMESALEGMFS